MLYRSFFMAVFFSVFLFSFSPIASENNIKPPTLGEDGLYSHDWFVESFLDLKEDFKAAKENNKRFVIFIEQRGCIYCRVLFSYKMCD